jgi:diguanylate cyclase (GGDEF)-like protein/PAS domain S-box-containing protein
VALGLAVLIGWHTENLALIQVRPGLPPMDYNTALAVLFCGAGLLALAFGRVRLVLAAALFPISLGGLTLVQYGASVTLGIDQFLHRSALNFGTLYPGRMGFTTALCLLFSGGALAALGRPAAFRGRPMVVGTLGLLTVGIALSVLSSYVTPAVVGVRWEVATAMALHTSLVLVLLGVEVIIAGWRDYVTGSRSPDVSRLRRASGMAWMVLALSVAATGAAWFVASRGMADRARARFDETVQQAHSAIITRMRDYEQVLMGGRGLFAGSMAIERSEWGAFVRSMELEQRFPGIQGVGFASYLRHRDKQRYESDIRQEGFSTFEIHPEGVRDDYVVTTYIEPFTGQNASTFGVDMHAEPIRRAALERARDTGQAAMSARVTRDPGSEQDVQPDVLLYVPIYQTGMPHTTIEERRAAIAGFTYAAFRMNDLMNGVLGRTARDIRFEIFDGPSVQRDRLLYGDEWEGDALPYRPMLQKTITSEISGHSWTFIFGTWPSFEAAAYDREPVMVLVGGLVVSLLLFGITWSLTTTRERALTLAKQMTDALRQSEAQFRAVADHANDAIVSADGRGTIIMWNKAAAAIFGYAEAEILGKPLPVLVSEQTWHLHEDALTRVASAGEHGGTGETMEVTGRRKDGREFPLELSLSAWTQGDQQFYTGILRDITERKQTQDRLDYLATHDALTGLPNRTLFADRLGQALARSAWNKRLVALMFLDLDRFKGINDTLGHDAGDLLLQTVATRLTAAVREGDTVARQGGDEFTIILIDMAHTDDVALVAQKILNAMAQPFNLNGHHAPVTFSIGIACYPVDGTDAQTLLKHADTALYQAKARGRNNYQLYSRDIPAKAS